MANCQVELDGLIVMRILLILFYACVQITLPEKSSKYMKENKPFVTLQDLNDLIEGLGKRSDYQVDNFFPLRFWFLVTVAFIYAFNLLLTLGEIAARLAVEPVEVARLEKYIYFRGWFIIFVTVTATYAYLSDWYFNIIIFCMFLIGSMNFLFDFFTVYYGQIGTPTNLLTAIIMLRLTVMFVVFVSIKNLSRIPEKKDRMNLLLPFRK
ncbi:MAG: hypothetical protein CFE38_01205 [Comamonadaceae bacterium PBBC1]|nr:MAG: hypothetical protein CFE38_01205 [Comamonadaceae bacterium PBBC1]